MPFEAAGKEDSSRVTESLALPLSSLDKDRKGLLAIVTPLRLKLLIGTRNAFLCFKILRPIILHTDFACVDIGLR